MGSKKNSAIKGANEKWANAFIENNKWNDGKAKKIQKLEAEIIAKWLLELDLGKYEILEIGCGNGYVGNVVIERLKDKNKEFTYYFSDLLEDCVNFAKTNSGDAIKKDKNVEFGVLDVYKLDKIFERNSRKIIISTGFASPATYRDAVPIVSKILDSNGILICDFINHLSPILLTTGLPKSVVRCINYIRGDKSKHYHLGKFGIKKYFSEFGLEMLKQKTVSSIMRNPLICMFKKTADDTSK